VTRHQLAASVTKTSYLLAWLTNIHTCPLLRAPLAPFDYIRELANLLNSEGWRKTRDSFPTSSTKPVEIRHKESTTTSKTMSTADASRYSLGSLFSVEGSVVVITGGGTGIGKSRNPDAKRNFYLDHAELNHSQTIQVG
jgi:UDP-N-acetylglucosamine enolpyruvyl transferase